MYVESFHLVQRRLFDSGGIIFISGTTESILQGRQE